MKKDQLVIDCSDRLNGFTLTLNHFAGQTMYVARKRYVTGTPGPALRVEFRFEQVPRAVGWHHAGAGVARVRLVRAGGEKAMLLELYWV